MKLRYLNFYDTVGKSQGVSGPTRILAKQPTGKSNYVWRFRMRENYNRKELPCS